MKRLLLFCLSGFIMTALSLEAQMTQLTITLDAKQMQNPDCWLGQGTIPNDKAYIHSGLCSSNASFCNDSIAPFNSPIWENVVGNWGLDDGIGAMSYQGNGIWNFVVMVESYYSMPNGETPYTIGLVFRDADGTNEGKDDQCGDIFIVDINTSNPRAVSGLQQAYAPVTVTKTLVGIEDVQTIGALHMGPNPFRDHFHLNFELRRAARDFSAKIYNTLGEEIAVLGQGNYAPGQQHLNWDTAETLPAGVYYLVLRDGERRLAAEKLVRTR